MKTIQIMISSSADLTGSCPAEYSFANLRMLFIGAGCLLLFLSLIGSVRVAAADVNEIMPFGTFNQSPLVQIYGLPHDTSAEITHAGSFRVTLNQDLSSNYTSTSTDREQIVLDGEAYRAAIVARYGIAPRCEVGVEIPYISQGGGFLDSFIIDWHNAFGLSQGGRDEAPKSRILYSYRKDGVQKLLVDRFGSGIGDISLTGGVSLYDAHSGGRHERLSLKGAVKLPTGDSSHLLGSGGTDAMVQLCGSSSGKGEWGTLGIYASAGALVMSKGDVLRDQHNQLAGVGTFGFGWGPAPWISFKAQLNGSTPLYRDSSLDELSRNPFLLIFGGTFTFPGELLLDIGVAEDVAVAASPDVSFHLGLSKRF